METLGEEIHHHLDEERQEKEKKSGSSKRSWRRRKKRSRSITTACSGWQPILKTIKRGQPETRRLTKFANEDLLRTILPFIDNLERAVNHAQKVADTGVLIEGVRLTIQQILQSLNKFGLSSFQSVGKPFDPTVHEAMLVVETDKHEPNQVVEEFQKGLPLE